jgi:hypothetical protein
MEIDHGMHPPGAGYRVGELRGRKRSFSLDREPAAGGLDGRG